VSLSDFDRFGARFAAEEVRVLGFDKPGLPAVFLVAGLARGVVGFLFILVALCSLRDYTTKSIKGKG
jgi:hypothetical protein